VVGALINPLGDQEGLPNRFEQVTFRVIVECVDLFGMCGGAMSYQSHFRHFLAVALIANLLLGPAVLTAQQGSTEVPSVTIRANTRLVIVDVVVTDKKGQPIAGLKPEDFTLEENGKKQKIAVFAQPGSSGAAQQPAAPAGIFSNHPQDVGPTSGQPTVLLLDAANSPFKDQSYARSQMLKYVLQQSQGGHPIAVLTLIDQVRVLQQFTSDPQVLMTAIKNFHPEEQILRASAPAPESHGAATGLDRGGDAGGLGDSLATAQLAVRAFADLQVGYNLQRRTEITIEAMRTLCRMLGGLPGRKNVVWLTSSLPFDLVPEDRNISEAELMADLPGQGRQRSVSTNAAGTYASEARQMYATEIKEAESDLASASIAIYPVDLTGLMSGMESSAGRGGSTYEDAALSNRAGAMMSAQEQNQGTMEEVAAHTGGKAYKNQNEIKDGIALAVADEKASYTLGYYAENKKWDGKFRNLKVKLDKGDTELRYRKGFYAVDPVVDKKANFDSEVASALQLGAPATQVSFMAQAKPGDPGKVRVVFLVDASTLSAEDVGANKRINANFYASIYDANGKVLVTRSIKVDHAFDAATYQQILAKGVVTPMDMDLPAGAKQVRLAVLDNRTGYVGTVSGPLQQ
jgi:VWFA-related protein